MADSIRYLLATLAHPPRFAAKPEDEVQWRHDPFDPEVVASPTKKESVEAAKRLELRSYRHLRTCNGVLERHWAGEGWLPLEGEVTRKGKHYICTPNFIEAKVLPGAAAPGKR